MYYQSVINGQELGSSVSTPEFFTPLAFDVLWEAMRLGDAPYPLALHSHGATEDERARLRDRVGAELEARGLRDERGRFEPRIETWMGLLSRPTRSVDALYIPAFEAQPIAVLAGADERNAVVALQDSDGVWIRPTFPDGIASAVVDLLPQAARGSEPSVTLPLDEALHIAPDRMPASHGRAPDQDGENESAHGRRGRRRQRALADRPSEPHAAYARLAGQPRVSGGQLAANSRNDVGQKQRSQVLAWFDTATGRYLSLAGTGTDGREWITVSPADAKTLRSRLGEMLGSLTNQSS